MPEGLAAAVFGLIEIPDIRHHRVEVLVGDGSHAEPRHRTGPDPDRYRAQFPVGVAKVLAEVVEIIVHVHDAEAAGMKILVAGQPLACENGWDFGIICPWYENSAIGLSLAQLHQL